MNSVCLYGLVSAVRKNTWVGNSVSFMNVLWCCCCYMCVVHKCRAFYERVVQVCTTFQYLLSCAFLCQTMSKSWLYRTDKCKLFCFFVWCIEDDTERLKRDFLSLQKHNSILTLTQFFCCVMYWFCFMLSEKKNSFCSKFPSICMWKLIGLQNKMSRRLI